MPPQDETPRGDAFPPGLARALGAHPAAEWPAAPVVFFEQTGSTNDVVLQAAASGAVDGTCVIARAQTAGRGRRGRTWVSPPGAGLYFSVLIRPPGIASVSEGGDLPGPAMLVTLMAAVAAVEALSAVAGFAPTIKWPNDLIVERGRSPGSGRWERRKLGGILAEGAVSQGLLEQVVVGIGINIAPGAYPPEVAGIATCVEAETGRSIDAFDLFAACRAALARERARLFAGGATDLLRRWRAHAPSAEGACVAWYEGQRRRTGLTAGLSDGGELVVVDDEDGERRRLVAGEVEWA